MLKSLAIAVFALLPAGAAPITMVSTCDSCDAGWYFAATDTTAAFTQDLYQVNEVSAPLALLIEGGLTPLANVMDTVAVEVQVALSSGTMQPGMRVSLPESGGEFLPVAGGIIEFLEALRTPQAATALLSLAVLAALASLRLRRKLTLTLASR